MKADGTINIGTKGDNIVSGEEPSITSTYTGTSSRYGGFGIYNPQGIVNFYDGRIEGNTRAITEDSVITEVEIIQQPQYSEDYTIYAYGIEVTDVARIGDVTYLSLQEAINDATENDIIEILRGIQYTNQDITVTIPTEKSITIDLQNNPIASAIEGVVFTVEGKLKIINTVEGENAKITTSYKNTISVKQGGTLEINGGIISNNKYDNDVIENEGNINITGGTILQENSGGYAINNTETGTINVFSGTISATDCGIYSQGETNINGGLVRGTYNAIVNANIGILNIKGGTITGSDSVIINKDSGLLNIENGIIGGNISGVTGIENQGNANINMTGGKINISRLYISYGINNISSGTINISGGEIVGLGGNINNDPGYGIYSKAGNINIGTNDGNINNEGLSILGTTNGIYASEDCTLNIYDGIIKGKTLAIVGNISEIEKQSEIVVGEETDENSNVYQIVSLIKSEIPLANINGTEYYSLKEAVEAMSETGTIQILRNATIAETVSIPSEKNITIDLNGYELKMYNKIQNNGNLIITDSSEGATGVLSTYKDSPMYNNGNLTIEKGNISGNTYGIYNQRGTTNVVGGNITDNTYGLYANGGTINVTGGNINNNQYGTFAYSGTINISQGNFTGNEYAVYNSSGTTNITGITLNGNTNNIYNGGSGTINVLGGNIITTDSTAIENASSGTIVIGEEGGTPSKENPLIQAEEYAIKNTGNGTIKFYDGIIKGRTGALQGLYLYTETGYTVKTDYIDGYYCDTLTPSGTVTTVAKIGNVEYSNLQSAINACTSSEPTTIQLVNSISTESTFQIEEGQNVIIDLNGKTITTSTAQTVINNAGTLAIIDTNTLQTGKITNETYNAIENSGTLTLGQDDGTVSTTCPEILGKAKAIINTGTLNFYDGIIKGATALEGTVTTRPSGYIMIKTTEETTGYEMLTLSL